MFTKIALSLVVIAGTASAALAQTKSHVGQAVQVSAKSAFASTRGATATPLYFKYATGAEWWKI